jgi:TolB-like protein/Tfp pilus assembly protein PilF
LSYDPALRYESAGSMEAALRQALDRTRPIDVEPAPPKPRPIWPWVATAAGLTAAVTLGAMLSRRAPEPTTITPAPAVATVAPLTQIAVLPLADLSGGTAPPFLADALTDQLIGTLGQVRALRVTSRTSILQFKSVTMPLPAIAKRLDVGSVLEGSLYVGDPSPSGERLVSINARLIAAGTDTQLWARTFQRQLGDLLALQAEIAQAVAGALNAALSPGEVARLEQVPPTNAAAAEAYYRGRYHLNQFGTANFRRAIVAFNRAIELDPKYALPHAGLARAYAFLGSADSISQGEARASALAAASRAIALDESLPEAHSELGDIKFYYDWDWTGAEASFTRAIDLNPSLMRARTQRARLMSARGRVQEAVEEGRRAEAADPLSAEAAQTVGILMFYARDYDGALKQLARALELDPNYARTHIVLSRVHEARRDWKAALSSAQRALTLAGGAEPVWQTQLARLRALSGDRAGAQRDLTQFLELNRTGKAHYSPAHLAYIYAALGNDEDALRLLERAVTDHDQNVLFLKVDPRLDGFRKQPRFEELVRRIGA